MNTRGGVDASSMDVIRPTLAGNQEAPARRLCRGCGTILAEVLVDAGVEIHPNCEDRMLQFNQPDEVPGTNHPMRTELINLIRWRDSNSARSRQVSIGPSEIGSSCDRRLAMRIAGVRAVNRSSDPWPAIVGTAMHDWLQRCLESANQRLVAQGQPPRWITESRVQADPLVSGTSDVYDTWTQAVIDWKSMGDTAKQRLAKEGPSDGYHTQIQTYGLGFFRAGFPVRKVALMFLPRAGMLKDARYFEWDFDPASANKAIARVYSIGHQVLALRKAAGIDEIWDSVPADPTNLCGWCPFFLRGAPIASSLGCPGKN
jgi:hypothetical protein